MNVVTGHSNVNSKHFTPNEVNLMVLNCYNTTRHQLDSVIYLSNSSGKSHWRLIAELFIQCSSACVGISLSLIAFYFARFYLLLSLRSINCVMFLEWSISNTIHLSIKDNRCRTDSPSSIPSPTSCLYFFNPCQFYIRSSVSLSSSSRLSCFILCHVVPSLAKPDFWPKAKRLVVIAAYLPTNLPLRKEKTVWLTSRAIKHCFYLHIPFSLTPDTCWVFNIFLWAWIPLISSHSTVQLDSCGSADSGNSGSKDWLLPGHEQRGIPLHLRKWPYALLRIDDYHY